MKNFLTAALFLFLMACNNETTDKKLVEKDSVSAVHDTTTAVTGIAPVNLDSITATPPLPSEAEPVALKFNLPVGKSFAYNTSIDLNQEMPGQKIMSTMSYNYILKVEKDNKGTRQMKVTYGDLAMQMDMNGKKMSFGAGQKSEPSNPLNMLGTMLSIMKGKSFVMDVNEQGEITRVDGFDKIADAVIEELKIPEASKESFVNSFKSQFNENSVKQMFGESFNFFPSEKVKPGDSWQKKASLPMAKKNIDVLTTYQLKGRQGNNYIIDASTKYQNAGSKPVLGTSRLLVNATTGLVMQLDGEQKMEGSKSVISRSRVRSKEL